MPTPPSVTVRVPATSANLGPGFDCLGVALDLWNAFTLHEAPGTTGIAVETLGEGAGRLPSDHTHLVAQVYLEEFTRITGHRALPFKLTCRNAVPAGSGLGSSSTAVLGGLLLAHAHVRMDLAQLSNPDGSVLKRAIELEGHGDNVAPALLGGLIVVSSGGTEYITRRVPVPALQVVVCVPDFHFLTSTARAVLPTQLSRADAIFNVGRAMLVLDALRCEDYGLLARALEDRIHEPYRMPAIPGAAEARRAALDHGAAAVALSGAGPGLIAFAPGRHDDIGKAMVQAYANAELKARYWLLRATAEGASVTRAGAAR